LVQVTNSHESNGVIKTKKEPQLMATEKIIIHIFDVAARFRVTALNPRRVAVDHFAETCLLRYS